MIPLFHTSCDPEETEIVAEVLRSGQLVMGEQVEGLEAELGAYLGRRVVTCASGTDALVLAVELLTQPGSRVVVPAMTFSATYEAVWRANRVPVLVDVDPETLTPSLEAIAQVVNGRTAAVILVHLHGWPAADIEPIAELCALRGVPLIEDCAQAFGAEHGGKRVGQFGDAAAFSFYPTKPLPGIGDGGAVAVRAPSAAEYIAARRNHGRTGAGQLMAGFNSRLDETNAAVIRHRLRTFTPASLLAGAYAAAGVEMAGSRPGRPSPYVFPIMVDDRDLVRERMAAAGIETRTHYDPAISGLPYVRNPSCPAADAAAARLLSLPCHRRMTVSDVETVAEALRQ